MFTQARHGVTAIAMVLALLATAVCAAVQKTAGGPPAADAEHKKQEGQEIKSGTSAAEESKNKKPDKSEDKASSEEKAPQNASTCRAVVVGAAGNAGAFATQLDKVGGVSVKAVGEQTLILCGSPGNVDVVARTVEALSGYTEPQRQHESHVVRLFYFRDAQAIAAAINESGGLNSAVKALGDDVVIFPGESTEDDNAIHELRRWIALLDVPRPEISMMAWSVQISSKDPGAMLEASTSIRELVSLYNVRIHNALERGWRYLESQRTCYPTDAQQPSGAAAAILAGYCEAANSQPPFFDPAFHAYLTHRYVLQLGEDRALQNLPQPICANDRYCLGYTRLFAPIQRSLTSMLIAVLATHNTAEVVDSFVDAMENRGMWGDTEFKKRAPLPGPNGTLPFTARQARNYEWPSGLGEGVQKGQRATTTLGLGRELPAKPTSAFELAQDECELQDLGYLQNEGEPDSSPAFSCLRSQLQESMGQNRSKALLRAALADFLFNYKSAEAYPQNFEPFYRGASAQAFDSVFNPFLVAFNRDLGVYLRRLQNRVTEDRKNHKRVDYSSDGLITLSVLSGSPAQVDTTTQSYFRLPPVFSTRDFVNAISGGSEGREDKSNTRKSSSSSSGAGEKGSGAAIPLVMSGNLTPLAAQALMAGIQAEQDRTAQIGRDLNLRITANALSGASAAELDVELNSGEHTPPRWLESGGSSSDDNVDRVAVHNTKTKVRVDSLKLFEISSLSATLTHGRYIPLIPPGVDLPYLGTLANLRLKPGTAYHQSFAIVSALIVPTAGDLANAIEFHSDLQISHLPLASWMEPAVQPQPAFHESSAENDKEAPSQNALQQPKPEPAPAKTARGNKRPGKQVKKDPDAQSQAAPARIETKAAFYWIVTHYREGDSVAGPFRKDVPAAVTSSERIQLSWGAPENAQSFDIYRTDSPDRKVFSECHGCVVAYSLRDRTYEDDLRLQAVDPKRRPRGEDITFERIATQPDNVEVFHKAKLFCLEKEADPTLPNTERIDCDSDGPSLRATPVVH